MFRVFAIGDWQGVGGSSYFRIAPDGLEAVKRREDLGLPASSNGRVHIEAAPVIDRRAAESWPEALNHDADLPLAINGDENSEMAAMVAAGIFAFAAGPRKFKNHLGQDDVGLSLELMVSPFELVCWRRAWSAEKRAEKAEKEVARLQELIEANAEESDESDE